MEKASLSDYNAADSELSLKSMKVWSALTAISFVALVTSPMLAELQDRQSIDALNELIVVEAVQEVVAYHPASVRLGSADDYTPPNFAGIVNANQRKEAFYAYILPKIHKANLEVVKERHWLSSMANKLVEGEVLSETQLDELKRFESRYALKNQQKAVAARVGELLLRVDIVPASLIVAQAAKESGWGTSRFAVDGNNFFGIWCFNRGCGLTPLRRDSGRGHEVATFDSVAQGVRYYVRTINTHVAYDELRRLRREARSQKVSIEGERLATGLLRYSERGLPYVEEVKSMIRSNKMQRFNRIYQV